jgi:hypothetical protein
MEVTIAYSPISLLGTICNTSYPPIRLPGRSRRGLGGSPPARATASRPRRISAGQGDGVELRPPRRPRSAPRRALLAMPVFRRPAGRLRPRSAVLGHPGRPFSPLRPPAAPRSVLDRVPPTGEIRKRISQKGGTRSRGIGSSLTGGTVDTTGRGRTNSLRSVVLSKANRPPLLLSRTCGAARPAGLPRVVRGRSSVANRPGSVKCGSSQSRF